MGHKEIMIFANLLSMNIINHFANNDRKIRAVVNFLRLLPLSLIKVLSTFS